MSANVTIRVAQQTETLQQPEVQQKDVTYSIDIDLPAQEVLESILEWLNTYDDGQFSNVTSLTNDIYQQIGRVNTSQELMHLISKYQYGLSHMGKHLNETFPKIFTTINNSLTKVINYIKNMQNDAGGPIPIKRSAKRIIKAMTPDDYYHKDKNVRAFIIKDGQLYVGPAHESHGLLAENHGITYGDGHVVSGRVSKSDNVVTIWDYAGDANPYSDTMANGIMTLFNKGLINNSTSIFITGGKINGMPVQLYFRFYFKKKQEAEEMGKKEEFSVYAQTLSGEYKPQSQAPGSTSIGSPDMTVDNPVTVDKNLEVGNNEFPTEPEEVNQDATYKDRAKNYLTKGLDNLLKIQNKPGGLRNLTEQLMCIVRKLDKRYTNRPKE